MHWVIATPCPLHVGSFTGLIVHGKPHLLREYMSATFLACPECTYSGSILNTQALLQYSLSPGRKGYVVDVPGLRDVVVDVPFG